MLNAILFAGLLGLAAAAPTETVKSPTNILAARSQIMRMLEIDGVKIGRAKRAPLPARAAADLAFAGERRAVSATVTGAAAVPTINNNDGVGNGSTAYTTYSGDGTTSAGWPDITDWVSFDDMFNNNKPAMMASCENDFSVADDSGGEIGAIYNAIENAAQQAEVDHRFILAIIMEESTGCVRVPTTGNGVTNPGLMQDHDGTNSCNSDGDVQDPCPTSTIQGMVDDGTIGTASGDGLASLLNSAESTSGTTGAQTFYWAARLYNSGSVCDDDLANACGATAAYASDIANRLTGWLG